PFIVAEQVVRLVVGALHRRNAPLVACLVVVVVGVIARRPQGFTDDGGAIDAMLVEGSFRLGLLELRVIDIALRGDLLFFQLLDLRLLLRTFLAKHENRGDFATANRKYVGSHEVTIEHPDRQSRLGEFVASDAAVRGSQRYLALGLLPQLKGAEKVAKCGFTTAVPAVNQVVAAKGGQVSGPTEITQNAGMAQATDFGDERHTTRSMNFSASAMRSSPEISLGSRVSRS